MTLDRFPNKPVPPRDPHREWPPWVYGVILIGGSVALAVLIYFRL